jgi:hypothetical protein
VPLIEPDQPPVDLDVEMGRRQPREQRRQLGTGEARIGTGPLQGDLEGVESVAVDQTGVGVAIEQDLDQFGIAHAAGDHQWGLAEDVAEVDPVLIDLAQHRARLLEGVGQEVGAFEQRHRLVRMLRGLEAALDQGIEQALIPIDQGVFHERDPRLLLALLERLVFQLGQRLALEHRPGHHTLLEDLLADLGRLLLLALEFETMRLVTPFLQTRLGALDLVDLGQRLAQSQQRQQTMFGLWLDQIQVLHRAGHGDVQGVDVELVDLQRLVALVADTRIAQLALQVRRTEIAGDLAKTLVLAGDEAVQQHVLVFQSLGLVDREHQRGAEETADLGLLLRMQHQDGEARRGRRALVEIALDAVVVLEQDHAPARRAATAHQIVTLAVYRAEAGVLDVQQPVGDGRDLGRVAEVGVEDTDQIRRDAVALLAPEQGLDLGPGEEIGVDDLVGVAAQQELARIAQGAQDEQELDIGQILDLVDDDEVIAWLDLLEPGMADQIGVEPALFVEEALVLFEQVIDLGPDLGRIDRLLDAERDIVLAAETGSARDRRL